MAWIKYIAHYKSGNGQPEWLDVGASSPEEIEDQFHEYDREHGDPDGLRTGEYEVFDLPPVKVLESRIKELTSLIARSQAYLLELNEMLAKAQASS